MARREKMPVEAYNELELTAAFTGTSRAVLQQYAGNSSVLPSCCLTEHDATTDDLNRGRAQTQNTSALTKFLGIRIATVGTLSRRSSLHEIIAVLSSQGGVRHA